MTAKRYLEKLSYYKEKRQALRNKRGELRIDIAARGIDYAADRVQSTPKNQMEEEGWRLLEKLQEVDSEIAWLTEEIDKRHDMIMKVSQEARMRVLYQRYYIGRALKEIAGEIGYSYDYVRRLNSEGLKEVEDMLKKSQNNTK